MHHPVLPHQEVRALQVLHAGHLHHHHLAQAALHAEVHPLPLTVPHHLVVRVVAVLVAVVPPPHLQ